MKNRVVVQGCTALLLALVAGHAYSVDSVTLEAGKSSDSTVVYRVSAQYDFGQTLWRNEPGSIQLEGYWDVGVMRWNRLDAYNIGLSPVFRLYFGGNGGGMSPFLEAGIGAAWFTSRKLGERDMGSRAQFEDRLAVGLRFDSGKEVTIRAFHYSNAGLASSNPGIEAVTLSYRLPL